jgi:hypothetical protein
MLQSVAFVAGPAPGAMLVPQTIGCYFSKNFEIGTVVWGAHSTGKRIRFRHKETLK